MENGVGQDGGVPVSVDGIMDGRRNLAGLDQEQSLAIDGLGSWGEMDSSPGSGGEGIG